MIGVYPPDYPPDLRSFPIGEAMNKSRQLQPSQVPAEAGGPRATGHLRPAPHLSRQEPMTDVIEAYHHFDRREPGWLKVKVVPG